MNKSAHPVSYSKTTITELMIPSYANFGGKIHGGIILSLIDKVAYACASKHSGMYCVTVSVDNVDFLQPVDVGELVHLSASVNYVGNTSVVVGIKVEAENIKTGARKFTNSSYVTMVAKDDDNKPATVPTLILENEEEVRRFVKAQFRKELKSNFRRQIKEAESTITFEKALSLLDGQRCEVQV
jgi:uncharacterized protein (TIGR00369 family)